MLYVTVYLCQQVPVNINKTGSVKMCDIDSFLWELLSCTKIYIFINLTLTGYNFQTERDTDFFPHATHFNVLWLTCIYIFSLCNWSGLWSTNKLILSYYYNVIFLHKYLYRCRIFACQFIVPIMYIRIYRGYMDIYKIQDNLWTYSSLWYRFHWFNLML